MKTSRRLLFILLLFAPVLFADKKDKKPAPAKKDFFAFAGTYTGKTQSKGIYAFRYDAASGKLTALGLATETPKSVGHKFISEAVPTGLIPVSQSPPQRR